MELQQEGNVEVHKMLLIFFFFDSDINFLSNGCYSKYSYVIARWKSYL